jgi:hypothetical protein
VPIRVVSTPSSEPGVPLQGHRALQGLATSTPSVTIGRVISVAFTAAPRPLPGRRLTRTSSGTKQLLDPENVNPLASFPLYPAFPRSEYCDASDAHTLHWGTALLLALASHFHNDVLDGRT